MAADAVLVADGLRKEFRSGTQTTTASACACGPAPSPD
jgi:hypothetical protein